MKPNWVLGLFNPPPIVWPQTCAECVAQAERYRAAGQWNDAAIEYVKAAERAKFPEDETELLEHAYEMGRRAFHRTATKNPTR